MASTEEKGRAKNISNFHLLCSNVAAFDAQYQPSNPALTVNNLSTKEAEAKAALEAYNNALATYTTATNNRKLIFAPVSPLLTRVRSAVKASGLAKTELAEVMINVDELINKYKGKRADEGIAARKAKAAAKTEGDDNLPDPISASHQSYVQRANTLQQLNALLATIPAYSPNITDLTVTSLANLQTSMSSQNDTVGDIITILDHARNNLKQSLNAPDSGLVDIALSTKDAIVSTYGHGSFQHRQVSGLSFTREK